MKEKNSTLIQFNIEKNCYNAGMIKSFAKFLNDEDNKTTLIPPYSVWTVKQKKKNKIVLDLAKDNSEYGFDMKPIF